MPRRIETRENASKKDLQTRYYGNDKKSVKHAVKNCFTALGFEMLSDNEKYGEMFFVDRTFEVTVTVYMYNPRETSVDYAIIYNGFLSFGKSMRLLKKMDENLKKTLQFKGNSRHAGR